MSIFLTEVLIIDSTEIIFNQFTSNNSNHKDRFKSNPYSVSSQLNRFLNKAISAKIK